MKKELVLFLFVFIFINFISSLNLYVDQNNPSCNDALPRAQNTFSTPWCTITRANDQHIGGDTVYILPGEYREKMFPKSGSAGAYTIYSGYGDRSQIKILGSNRITGWILNGGNVYSISFTPEELRCEHGVLDTHGTDCFENRVTWLKKEYNLANLNQDGEFYYDNTNFVLYFYSTSGNPSSRMIECSSRRILGLTNWDPHPSGYVYPSYFTIQNFTIMQSLLDGMDMYTYTHDVNIFNNEFEYNSGGGKLCTESSSNNA